MQGRKQIHVSRPQRWPARPPRPAGNTGGSGVEAWYWVGWELWYQLNVPNNTLGISVSLGFIFVGLSNDGITPLPGTQVGIDSIAWAQVGVKGDAMHEDGPFTATPSALPGSDSHFDIPDSNALITFSGIQPQLVNLDVYIYRAGAENQRILLGGGGGGVGPTWPATFTTEGYKGDTISGIECNWSLVVPFAFPIFVDPF